MIELEFELELYFLKISTQINCR